MAARSRFLISRSAFPRLSAFHYQAVLCKKSSELHRILSSTQSKGDSGKKAFKFGGPWSRRKTVLMAMSGSLLGAVSAFYAAREYFESPLTSKRMERSKVKISRSMNGGMDTNGLKLTLFQYQTCPFCCKVRAFLDFRGFSYNVVEVNSIWRTQIKWSKYKKVPILVCDGVDEEEYLQINDSSVIMSLLDSYLLDRSQSVEKLLSYFPAIETTNKKGKTVYDFPNKYFIMFQEEITAASPDSLKEEREWRKWVDDVLVHTLSPNVYRTFFEALQTFKYFSEAGEWEKNFSAVEQFFIIYIGAVAMYFIGMMLKKRYKLKDDVRQSLYDACRDWVKVVGEKRFMGGHEPNLADLSVYGVLSSIEGCNAFKDLLQNTKIGPWYYQVQKAVKSHQGMHSVQQI